jgi:hypothetical protein
VHGHEIGREVKMAEILVMTRKALERSEVLGRLERNELKQKDAAILLGLGVRQTRNVFKRYKEEGPSGLNSRLLGKPGNRRYGNDFRELVLGLVQSKYPDFKATLAAEYLYERDNVKVCAEMILPHFNRHLFVNIMSNNKEVSNAQNKQKIYQRVQTRVS